MSWPFSGCLAFSPTSLVDLRSLAAVQALLAAIRTHVTAAPSIRARAINSPCESATATVTAFCMASAFSVIRSMIFLASEYSRLWVVRMLGFLEDCGREVHGRDGL